MGMLEAGRRVLPPVFRGGAEPDDCRRKGEPFLREAHRAVLCALLGSSWTMVPLGISGFPGGSVKRASARWSVCAHVGRHRRREGARHRLGCRLHVTARMLDILPVAGSRREGLACKLAGPVVTA